MLIEWFTKCYFHNGVICYLNTVACVTFKVVYIWPISVDVNWFLWSKWKVLDNAVRTLWVGGKYRRQGEVLPKTLPPERTTSYHLQGVRYHICHGVSDTVQYVGHPKEREKFIITVVDPTSFSCLSNLWGRDTCDVGTLRCHVTVIRDYLLLARRIAPGWHVGAGPCEEGRTWCT